MSITGIIIILLIATFVEFIMLSSIAAIVFRSNRTGSLERLMQRRPKTVALVTVIILVLQAVLFVYTIDLAKKGLL